MNQPMLGTQGKLCLLFWIANSTPTYYFLWRNSHLSLVRAILKQPFCSDELPTSQSLCHMASLCIRFTWFPCCVYTAGTLIQSKFYTHQGIEMEESHHFDQKRLICPTHWAFRLVAQLWCIHSWRNRNEQRLWVCFLLSYRLAHHRNVA